MADVTVDVLGQGFIAFEHKVRAISRKMYTFNRLLRGLSFAHTDIVVFDWATVGLLELRLADGQGRLQFGICTFL